MLVELELGLVDTFDAEARFWICKQCWCWLRCHFSVGQGMAGTKHNTGPDGPEPILTEYKVHKDPAYPLSDVFTSLRLRDGVHIPTLLPTTSTTHLLG